MKGFVDFVAKNGRGFGFAYDLQRRTRYFFHFTNVEGALPQVGNLIEFTPGTTLRGPVALNVKVLDTAATIAALLSAAAGSGQ